MRESRNVLAGPLRPWTAIDDSSDADYCVRHLDQARKAGMGPLEAQALGRGDYLASSVTGVLP